LKTTPITFKAQKTTQDSDQSYLGLTDNDFANAPFRRYGLSALDNIATEHDQVMLGYSYEFNDETTFTATIYNNNHERDWFKTEGIDLNGSANAQDFDRSSWTNVINAINTSVSLSRDADTFTAAQLQAIVDGSADTAPFLTRHPTRYAVGFWWRHGIS